MGHRVVASAAFAAILLLSACSKLSDVGDEPQTGPNVEAAAVNQPYTRDAATGKITLSVRSGSEVVLTGKGSEGTVAPILKFSWAQSNTAAKSATVIRRNANTISFTTPTVTTNTLLQFKLTVTDSNDKTATADADINVIPLTDQNRFLTYLGASTTFTVVPVTDVAVTPAQMTGDVPISVNVARTITYTDLDGHSQTLTLPASSVAGSWFKAYGTGDGSNGAGVTPCGGFPNPRLAITVPAIEADQVAALVQDTAPAHALNPSAIDQTTVNVTLTITQTGNAGTTQLPAGRTPLICVEDGTGTLITARTDGSGPQIQAHSGEEMVRSQAAPASTVTVDLATLAGPAAVTADNAESADAYYATIDTPADSAQKSTFLGWLKANGFVAPSAQTLAWADVEAGSTAHAVYVNNFDLGFGRDMYARRFSCTANPPAPGQCDIAAVVVNYTSLEGAAKKTNPIVAVAMEYRATPQSSGARVVKFYTFAPNVSTGEFFRVKSVDLDRRGEKYMPGACTVCHGGTPGGPLQGGNYANGGELDAGFLPWDLDALLYSDTDGNFSTRPEDANLRSRFTRSAQEAQLKQLNSLAYLTYHDPTIATNNGPVEQIGRFALVRQLVEGWYGGATLPANTFSAFVPPEWRPRGADDVAGTADDNAADSDVVYRDQFAKHCRMCHTLHNVPIDPAKQVNGSWDPRLSPACSSDTLLDTSANSHQLPMGCYRQFVRAPNIATRLANAEMPLARLTADRLWVPGTSGTPPGDALINHLKQRFTSVGDTDSLALLAKPGQGVARIKQLSGLTNPPDIGNRVEADGTTSTAANTFAWTLERCTSGTPAVLACRGDALPPIDEPSLACSAAPEGILTPDQSIASFSPVAAATYRVGLAVNGGTEKATQVFRVPSLQPCVQPVTVANPHPQDLGTSNVSVAFALPFESIVNLGNGAAADHTVLLTPSGGSVPVTIAPATCATDGCPASQAITLTPTQTGNAALNLHVTDVDGDAKDFPLTFVSSSSLTAQSQSLTTDPNTDLPITIAGASADVEILIEQQQCADDGLMRDVCLLSLNNTRASIVTPTDTGFTYRPPTNFSTQPKNVDTDRVSPEVITYRLRRKNNHADISEQGFITVRIRATASFTEAKAAFNSNIAQVCSSCHKNGGSAPNYPGADYTGTNPEWRNGNIQGIGVTIARVDLSNAAQSGLVCWPRHNCTGVATNHTGGTRSAAEIAPILKWIESGANNDVDP